MNKNPILIAVAAVAIFVGVAGLAWWSGHSTPFVEPPESTKILFYGTGCPHCKIVEQFIQDNQVTNWLSFEQREIFFDQNNAGLMKKRADRCGIAQSEMGVPLFWDGQKCYGGDQEIINYFSSFNPLAVTSSSTESATTTVNTLK